MRTYGELLIGGKWLPSQGGEAVELTSPHSEETIGRVTLASKQDIDAAVSAGRKAFDSGEWADAEPRDRCDLVAKFAQNYQSRLPEMSRIISREMGSPITFAELAQGPAAWMIITTMVEQAKQIEWEERRPSAVAGDIIVRREPVGVVGAIVPWNFPQGLAMPKLVAASHRVLDSSQAVAGDRTRCDAPR